MKRIPCGHAGDVPFLQKNYVDLHYDPQMSLRYIFFASYRETPEIETSEKRGDRNAIKALLCRVHLLTTLLMT